MRRDLGDFQTPPALVAAVLDRLGPIGVRWPRVLEPTCGRGHFLEGLIGRGAPPREVRGVEIQHGHAEAARAVALGAPPAVHAEVMRASLFDLDLRRDLRWSGRGPLLVVGNPPWVTNAELGALDSENLPRKRNLKKLRGIDARTGASNFDIAEAIWLKLIDELADEEPTIALLCKTSVARSVLEFAGRATLPVARAALFRIDAARWFRAAVDACLFCVTLGPGGPPEGVPVFDGLGASAPSSEMGFAAGRLVADLDAYRAVAFADGRCPLTWRQGLKHDAASVMELIREGASGPLRNKRGEVVDIEPVSVYPLLKGADLPRPPAERPSRFVIVTQQRIGLETGPIEHSAPRLWRYLHAHAAEFSKRKSSIYRGQPPFAMFGIGPYSFAPHKVAISGLHKAPKFHAVGPVEGRPVMLDDTCYFVACPSPERAALVSVLLNAPAALGMIRALAFREAKRPITKAILQRIDLGAIAGRANRSDLPGDAGDELERFRSHLAMMT